MSVDWFAAGDAQWAASACAQHVLLLLESALSAQEFAAFAVSGGATPKLLFDELAASRFEWNRVHLFWVDERCVPPTAAASNYKLVSDHLIRPANIPLQHVHRIMGELAPQDAAASYTADIRSFFKLGPGELPRFDIVHRGMGPDAHSASLFPGDPLIDDRDGIAAATFAPQFNQWRVTLLPGALLAAKQTVFLVAGADKSVAVRAVFKEPYDPMKYPAQIATHQGRAVTWFLDDQAAALLD
jgi:6-phosphogluconolactonase